VAKQGAFTFVLHSHIPYCRSAGRWPHGEEWLHEAAAETYIPLLRALYDLRDEGVPYRLTIGLTPVLAEQLRDPLINDHLNEYLETRIQAAAQDGSRLRAAGKADLASLAEYYHAMYSRLLADYRDAFAHDLVGAFGELQKSGHIEIATSGATHGYLPLLERDSSVAAQIGVGVASYEQAFGRRPRAIWLPECAYRPAVSRGGFESPGIERFLEEQGLSLFFTETQSITGGQLVGKVRGDAVGPYGVLAGRGRPRSSRLTRRTTFEPYYVGDSDVAVLARNSRTGLQVWSGEHGYPGDGWYREFHRKDDVSGLQYWRTTARNAELGDKAVYQPDRAAERVRYHARHFASLVEEEIGGYHSATGRYGIVCAAYDTELFGHWWLEGIDWLREVLRLLAASEIVETCTAIEFVDRHPPEEAVALPEGSWGQNGDHSTWKNPDTEWMWPVIHSAEQQMERLVETHPSAAARSVRDALDQAARELLLLESSDWPFLVTTGQAREYAIERFRDHVARFEQLAAALQGASGSDVGAMAAELYERDRLFANIDYQRFRNREHLRASIAS